MANFISQLGKGFIRSAVNQVGRDSGKVVSNSIYGDKHSVPIRNTGSKYSGRYIQGNIDVEINRENGYVYVCKNSTSKKVLWYILALLFAQPFFIFIMLYLLYVGIKKKKQEFVYVKKLVPVPLYVSDRRYRDGVRFWGYDESFVSKTIPAEESDKAILKKVGNTYIVIAIISLVIESIWLFSILQGS